MQTLSKVFIHCFLATALSGCATGRIADVRDCVNLSAGMGLGLGVQARFGGLSHPSLGLMSSGPRIGFENRHIAGAWYEMEGFVPLFAPMVFNAGPLEYEGSLANLSYSRICDNYSIGAPDAFRMGQWINCNAADDPHSSAIKRAADIEIGASLLFVSARIGINPLEIFDLFLGFMGLDIAHDDPQKEIEGVIEGVTLKGSPISKGVSKGV